MMPKHKLEKNTVINKIVPDFMDTVYIYMLPEYFFSTVPPLPPIDL